MNKEILGLESALDEAKSKPMQGMVISCSLVVELAEEIKSLKVENERLKTRVENCESVFYEAPDLTFEQCLKLFPSEFAVHKLKQQAKGIAEAVSKSITPSMANWPDDEYLTGFMDCTNSMLSIAANLTKQAGSE